MSLQPHIVLGRRRLLADHFVNDEKPHAVLVSQRRNRLPVEAPAAVNRDALRWREQFNFARFAPCAFNGLKISHFKTLLEVRHSYFDAVVVFNIRRLRS